MATFRAFIAVGSNLGDRVAWHEFATDQLGSVPGVEIHRATPIRETQPLGGADQPRYLNRMLLVNTRLEPPQLLAECQRIERDAGRDRAARWCSRTLDLDLVRFDTFMCDTAELALPHYGLRDRIFWALEIAELESDD